MTAGYGAVLVDEPVAREQGEVAGAVIMNGAEDDTLATVNDPRFVVLTHPIESSALASTGYGNLDLVREGRYVEVTNVICRRCGTVFPRRRLAAPGVGCGVGLLPGAAVGVVVGFGSRSFLAGIFTCYVVAGLVGLVATGMAALYVRRRHRERAAALAAEVQCPTCRSEDAMPIDGAKGVRCSSCGQDALRFVIAGMS
ncbi:MAG TPA: hypothetical protein VFB66_29315 [Tepidisphaeraceae bacterium]|nr:hypothetical protein [Tepidisphaeraceae bacterium]